MFGRGDEPSDAGRTSVNPNKGGVGLLLISAAFILGALGLTYVFLVAPIRQVLATRSWLEVQCVIISSDVEEHEDEEDGDTTYSFSITYSYEIKGQQFRSDRYQFTQGSSSNRSLRQALVDHYPPGSPAVCYVDPEDSSQAVIERGFTPEIMFGLFPLALVMIGGAGIVYSIVLLKRRSDETAGQTWQHATACRSDFSIRSDPAGVRRTGRQSP